MECPICFNENPDTNVSCAKCGRPIVLGLSYKCTKCGNPVKPHDVRCPKCKTPRDWNSMKEIYLKQAVKKLPLRSLAKKKCPSCGKAAEWSTTECFVCGERLPKVDKPLFEADVDLPSSTVMGLARAFFEGLGFMVDDVYPEIMTFTYRGGLSVGTSTALLATLGFGGLLAGNLLAEAAKEKNASFYILVKKSNERTLVESNLSDFILWIKQK